MELRGEVERGTKGSWTRIALITLVSAIFRWGQRKLIKQVLAWGLGSSEGNRFLHSCTDNGSYEMARHFQKMLRN